MSIIALANQKGGVGKTTTAVNLAAGLAGRGQRVLLIDCDPQGSASAHLGIRGEESGLDLANVLAEENDLVEIIHSNVVVSGLDVAPASTHLAGVATALNREVGGVDRVLAMALRPLKDRYDLVLMDCPPSLDILTINALVAASEVYACVETQYFGLAAIARFEETVERVQRRLNPDLSLTGVVACRMRRSTRLAQEVESQLRSYFGERMFQTEVRENVQLAEAPSHGLPIFAYAPRSPGAEDYAALAEEVLKRA